jgi:hypothetical protein
VARAIDGLQTAVANAGCGTLASGPVASIAAVTGGRSAVATIPRVERATGAARNRVFALLVNTAVRFVMPAL